VLSEGEAHDAMGQRTATRTAQGRWSPRAGNRGNHPKSLGVATQGTTPHRHRTERRLAQRAGALANQLLPSLPNANMPSLCERCLLRQISETAWTAPIPAWIFRPRPAQICPSQKTTVDALSQA